MLYEMLTGKRPFDGNDTLETLRNVIAAEAPAVRGSNRRVARDLETICLKCLEKESGRRYASAQELWDELERFCNGEPIRARPLSGPARAWRWCRRKPLLAGLWASLALLLLTLGIGGPLVAFNQAVNARTQADLRSQAEEARVEAERRGQEAEDARADAEARRQEADQERLRAYRGYYLVQMNLAQRDWEILAIDQVLDRVSATSPEGTGGYDFRGFEWHYWSRRCHSDLMTLKGHTGMVFSVSFSPDGTRIASGGRTPLQESRQQPGELKVWDVATGQELSLIHI